MAGEGTVWGDLGIKDINMIVIDEMLVNECIEEKYRRIVIKVKNDMEKEKQYKMNKKKQKRANVDVHFVVSLHEGTMITRDGT